jgi:hypothetical protein
VHRDNILTFATQIENQNLKNITHMNNNSLETDELVIVGGRYGDLADKLTPLFDKGGPIDEKEQKMITRGTWGKACCHFINKIKEHYRLDKFLTPFAKLVNECAKKNEYYYVDFKGDKSFLQSVLNHVCQMPLGKEKAVSPNIIIQVQQAEINVNCPGNQIIQQQKNDYNKKANSNG